MSKKSNQSNHPDKNKSIFRIPGLSKGIKPIKGIQKLETLDQLMKRKAKFNY